MTKKLFFQTGPIASHYFLLILFMIFSKMALWTQLFAKEIVLPTDQSLIYFQTNGPLDNLDHGDWWSSEHPKAGGQPHHFEIVVPPLVDSNFVAKIELFDPESFQTGTEFDELEGTDWDSTYFYLLAPDSQTVIQATHYPPEAKTSEKWTPFAQFRVGDYGFGKYKLMVKTHIDDQNTYKLKLVENNPNGIANDGDEISLTTIKSSFQHIENTSTGLHCWFFVPQKPELRLSNFDLDIDVNKVSIEYIDPSGQKYPGTPSSLSAWNNGGLEFPPPGGDVFSNPEPGWWQAKYDVSMNNQYIFYAEHALILDGPPNYPALSIEKSDNISSIRVNDQSTFTIVLKNNGTGPALNITVVDTLPSGLSFIHSSYPYKIESEKTQEIIQWQIDKLDPLAEQVIDLTASVNVNADISVQNKSTAYYSDIYFNQYPPVSDSDNNIVERTPTLGGNVWLDLNGSGTREIDEPGLEDVTLRVSKETGSPVSSTKTRSTGHYIFKDLKSGTYVIDVDLTTLPGQYVLTTNNAPMTITLGSFEHVLDANFGFMNATVAIELSSFNAKSSMDGILLNWVTESETENLGFHIYRSTAKNGEYKKVTRSMIEGAGNSQSTHEYQYLDTYNLSSQTYYYKLADIDYNGNTKFHGPIDIQYTIPQKYSLEQNFPNPFNPKTTIHFNLQESGFVKLQVYNIQGQQVKELISSFMQPGNHSVVWNGRDDFGNTVPSGTFIYRIQVNEFSDFKKMTLLR